MEGMWARRHSSKRQPHAASHRLSRSAAQPSGAVLRPRVSAFGVRSAQRAYQLDLQSINL